MNLSINGIHQPSSESISDIATSSDINFSMHALEQCQNRSIMKTIKHRITNFAAQNSKYSAPGALQLIAVFTYWQKNNKHKTQQKELL